MSKERVKVTINSNEEEGDVNVKITLTDEAKSRIPTPGQSIYVIEPYPVDDEDDENESKEKVVMGFSYAGILAKAVVLNDDLDEVTVNGDYRIPLYKDTTDSGSGKRLIVCSNENEAIDKYRTLMNASIKEAKRRMEKAVKIHDYLEEQLEKMHH
jgi:hypothetical protein